MLTLHFTQDEQQQLHHQRFYHPDPRVQKKMEVVYFKSHQLPHHQIARLCQLSTRTVGRYLHQYQDGGIEALKQSNYTGKVSDLAQHQSSLGDYFDQHPPHTIKQAQALIEEQTGIRRSETQVRQFLRQLGFKRLRCAAVPGKALDPKKQQEQRQFHDKELQPHLDQAEQGERRVLFVDASHFVFGAFLGYLWCLVRKYLPTPSGRKRYNVLGALDFVTKEMVTLCNTGYVTATTVCDLLHRLVERYPGQALTLVLDNARYQRCALVQDLAKSLGIELLFLPSYSPNLNLIERVWKFVKAQCLRGEYYETFEQFQQAIDTTIEELPTKHRAQMQSLITRNFQLFDNRTISTV